MKVEEAAELIEAIIKSIREHPSQFHFDISIIGTKATGRDGGIGILSQAIGGGPGSQTIGYNSRLEIGGNTIEIAKKAANDEIRKEMSALVESLNIIVVEMRSKKPDRKRIDEILDYLGKQKWVPNLIISIVGSIIAASVMSA